MPLADVVQYFNQRLPELHPLAHLSSQARLQLRNGRVAARIGGFRLIPRQLPVVTVAAGEPFAWSAKLLAESQSGRRAIPETLYVQAWDSEDVIFLDRFLRTLHALHHLSLGPERPGLLAVDVHLRHVAALPEQHGRVFETLLRQLGLEPSQIVLRLSGSALQHDPHVRDAASSFSRRGYGLLATRPDLADADWSLLRSVGVQWVAPDPAVLAGPDPWTVAEDWSVQAKAHGIGLWLDGVEGSRAIARASELGADLIEGVLWEPISHPGGGQRAGRGAASRATAP